MLFISKNSIEKGRTFSTLPPKLFYQRCAFWYVQILCRLLRPKMGGRHFFCSAPWPSRFSCLHFLPHFPPTHFIWDPAVVPACVGGCHTVSRCSGDPRTGARKVCHNCAKRLRILIATYMSFFRLKKSKGLALFVRCPLQSSSESVLIRLHLPPSLWCPFFEKGRREKFDYHPLLRACKNSHFLLLLEGGCDGREKG